MLVWRAGNEVTDLVQAVKEKFHLPRLENARIAVSLNDGKPFKDGRFNWGTVQKFSPADRVWHVEQYDFHISLPADAWHSILVGKQREAWLDLRLACCQVEYVPVMVTENGKTRPVKDEWGRTEYTDEIKCDDDGNPKWKVIKLDLHVFQDNIMRYGCWCQDLLDFRSVFTEADRKDLVYE